MKRRTTIYLLSFLLALSVAKADDIATIKSFLDAKSDDQAVLHSVYMACLNLTRTGTEDAVPLLTQLLDDERFTTVARTALVNIQGKGAAPLQQVQTQDAVMLALLLDEEKGTTALVDALKKDSEIPFRITLRAVLEMKPQNTGILVLNNMGDLSIEQQAALVRNLGARKDSVAIVPQLMELASGDKPELQFAAVEALGEIGDLRAVDTLLLLTAEGADADISKTAAENLKLFQGDDFNQKIFNLLDTDSQKQQQVAHQKLVLAALDVIAERRIPAADDSSNYHRLLMFFANSGRDPGGEIRAAAYRAFALSAPASVSDIILVLVHWKRLAQEGGDQTPAKEALLTLCRRVGENRNIVANNLVEVLFNNADLESRLFCFDCLFQLGDEKAAFYLADIAMGIDGVSDDVQDALTDKATQLLGRWTTPEVAPFLIDIAEKHPNERYRSRTLSGYLRVIRQMGLPVEQKVQMAEKALAVARTDADKQRADEVLQRFKAMIQGTPIFDGKTFDGWEFRGNEEWFRIADGAIVGGTFDRPIPRNEFIVSKKEYGDFTLRIECKALGRGCNGGVQFRSVRTPADGNMPNEMIGYQADMTDTANYWGALYDESRRNRFIAEPPKELIERIFRPNDWNDYEIVCRGKNVKIYLNGELTVDYTEQDETIPVRGFIGLQIHSGPPSETWYRNIRVEE